MSKGSQRRPRQVSREEEDLRWEYATTDMSLIEFNRKLRRIKRMGKHK